MCNMEGGGGGVGWGKVGGGEGGGGLNRRIKELIFSGNSKYIFKLI